MHWVLLLKASNLTGRNETKSWLLSIQPMSAAGTKRTFQHQDISNEPVGTELLHQEYISPTGRGLLLPLCYAHSFG